MTKQNRWKLITDDICLAKVFCEFIIEEMEDVSIMN